MWNASLVSSYEHFSSVDLLLLLLHCFAIIPAYLCVFQVILENCVSVYTKQDFFLPHLLLSGLA